MSLSKVDSSIKLRKYQIDLVENIKQSLKNSRKSVCAVLSCGGGKSVVAAHIASSATDKGNTVLFLVHRKELCEQIYKTFCNYGVDMNLCTIGMVQTITRRLDSTEEPSLIICDEFHHATSATYRRIFERFIGSLLIGFTATPIRLNDGGLGDVAEELIESVSTKWLIENNYLSPYKYYSVPVADVSKIKVTRGEYDNRQLSDLMETKYIYGETVKNYKKIADNKKTIVYCVSVESAKQTADEFKRHGYSCESLDGNTPKDDRQRVMQEFRDNKIKILCNCELFGEGLDIPDVECAILLRKTRSLTLYIQQAMRSMRYKLDKTAIIIDHVGNIFEHDYPDASREWSLDAKKHKSKNEAPVKQCEMCFMVMPSNVSVCSECGFEFPKKEIEEKETIDLELQEITALEILKSKPYNYYLGIKSWDRLDAFRKAKSFKFMWSIHKALELGILIPDKYNSHVRRARK